MNLFDLSGHVAVVTGGNGGIGLGLASGIAKAGGKVAIWARNEAKNAAAATQLEELGAEVIAVRCDVARPEDVTAAMAATLERFQKVDSMFVNSGTTGAGAFTDLTADEFQRVLDVNVTGAFLCMQAAVAHMLDRGEGGAIVAVASVAATKGLLYSPHYSASKGGIRQLARALAAEVGPKGINVNIISPGFVESEMTEPLMASDSFQAAIKLRVPLKRWGRPEDFERVAAFLASEAGGFMAGSEIIVDGGLHAY